MIKIYTTASNRPDFIDLQARTFKKFIKDEYEYVVVNDAVGGTMRFEVVKQCRRHGVRCVDVQYPNHVTGCYACARAIQSVFDYQILMEKPEIAVILDSDVFAIKPFSFEEYMRGYDFAGIQQDRKSPSGKVIPYYWNVFMILRTNSLPAVGEMNFECGYIEGVGVDVGGKLYYYFTSHPNVPVRNMSDTGPHQSIEYMSEAIGVDVKNIYKEEYKMEVHAGSFLHYRSGTNWDNKPAEYVNEKNNALCKIIEMCMERTAS